MSYNNEGAAQQIHMPATQGCGSGVPGGVEVGKCGGAAGSLNQGGDHGGNYMGVQQEVENAATELGNDSTTPLEVAAVTELQGLHPYIVRAMEGEVMCEQLTDKKPHDTPVGNASQAQVGHNKKKGDSNMFFHAMPVSGPLEHALYQYLRPRYSTGRKTVRYEPMCRVWNTIVMLSIENGAHFPVYLKRPDYLKEYEAARCTRLQQRDSVMLFHILQGYLAEQPGGPLKRKEVVTGAQPGPSTSTKRSKQKTGPKGPTGPKTCPKCKVAQLPSDHHWKNCPLRAKGQ